MPIPETGTWFINTLCGKSRMLGTRGAGYSNCGEGTQLLCAEASDREASISITPSNPPAYISLSPLDRALH